MISSFGSEVVKIEGACLSVSQVSGETHSAATDTPRGVFRGEHREERKRRRHRKDKTENEKRPCGYEDRKEKW